MFSNWIRIDDEGNVHVFGIKLVGVTAENGEKLLFTPVLVSVLVVLNRVAKLLALHRMARASFRVRQGIDLSTAVLMILGLVSARFDDAGVGDVRDRGRSHPARRGRGERPEGLAHA